MAEGTQSVFRPPVGDKTPPPTVELFGFPVLAQTMEQAVSHIRDAIDSRTPTIHVVLNAAKVSKAERDGEFNRLLAGFDMIHADGASVVLAGRLLGRPLPERVAGIDLMAELVGLAAREGYRPFLLGAKPDVVEDCAQRLLSEYPGLELAGFHHGYWDENDPAQEEAVLEQVRRSGADMLFVAVPTPRKERFLARYRDRLGVPFSMGVGGAFDVVSGRVARAPAVWQRNGMEWAYRLLMEPRKMWKRYLTTNAHFAWLLGRERLRRRTGR